MEVAKPEPPPAPHLAFLRDPWGKEQTGAWYRIKTVSNGQESYRDIGLRETGAGYRVLVSQTSAAGKTEPEQFTWTEPEETSVAGSVNGDAQGTKYTADVVRTKSARRTSSTAERVILAIEAIVKAPSVSAGSTRCRQSPRPDVGNRSSRSARVRMNRMPMKNVGAA